MFDDLTIVGKGVPGTTIKATATNWHDAHYRIFTGGSGSFGVTVKDMRLANGHEGYGGAMLFNPGQTVLIDHVTFSDNAADGLGSGSGGAIYTFGASLTVINSRFFDNLAGIGGGAAITTSGNLVVTDSEFKGNVSLARAGAILVLEQSTASISRTDISFNDAATGGGAIEVGASAVSDGANVTVTNSTISNNTGYAAIYNYGNASNQITLANATVSATTGFSIGGRGISMRNTILDHGTGPNCDVWPVASLGQQHRRRCQLSTAGRRYPGRREAR